MALNPITALSEQLQKLINEHGSAAILRDHLALFKDKVVLLEQKAASLESENVILKAKLDNSESDFNKSQKDNEELRSKIQQYEQPSHGVLLEEVKVNILLFMAKHEEVYAQHVASALKIGLQTAQFHLEELQETNLVSSSYCTDEETPWYLAQGGRKYLVRNNLIT